jgi:NitT/TauT family transport system substrate-binding protein
MDASRRRQLSRLSLGLASGVLPGWWGGAIAQSRAEGGQPLTVNLLGFSLGIHVPAVAAAVELLPATPGYAAPKINRIAQNRTLTQALISGTADIAETDVVTIVQAVEAGADLRMIGNVYNNTSIVFVANADKVQDIKDLEKPDVTVAVNGVGDVSHIMLVGPLMKRGVDIGKVKVVEIGGSGDRMRALLAKRVDAVPVHFDQVPSIADKGNFKILFKPWQEYPVWITEAWAVNGAWLRKPENQRAAVDFMKAVITASRRANTDFAWYAEKYRKHCTLPNAAQATDDQLRPVWSELSREIKAWPPSNNFSADNVRQLLPVFKAAQAVAGTASADAMVDVTYTQQALKELGG